MRNSQPGLSLLQLLGTASVNSLQMINYCGALFLCKTLGFYQNFFSVCGNASWLGPESFTSHLYVHHPSPLAWMCSHFCPGFLPWPHSPTPTVCSPPQKPQGACELGHVHPLFRNLHGSHLTQSKHQILPAAYRPWACCSVSSLPSSPPSPLRPPPSPPLTLCSFCSSHTSLFPVS